MKQSIFGGSKDD